MKALSSHLKLSILGGLEIGGLSSQKFSYAPQTHSIPVLFCGVLELRLVTHLCVVASIFMYDFCDFDIGQVVAIYMYV